MKVENLGGFMNSRSESNILKIDFLLAGKVKINH